VTTAERDQVDVAVVGAGFGCLGRHRELRHPPPCLVVIERSSLISVLAGRLLRGALLHTGCAVKALEREDRPRMRRSLRARIGTQHTLRPHASSRPTHQLGDP
jgi:hypothetical protein